MKLKNIKNEVIDLSHVEFYVEHYKNYANFAQVILTELNQNNIFTFFESDKNDLIAFDLGANVGMVSMYIYPICKKIYAFEPSHTHHRIFKHLINHFDLNKIQLEKKAIATHTGYTDFQLDYGNNNMNRIPIESTHYPIIKVKCTSLIDYVQENNINKIDIMKIDIEGYERTLFFDKSFIDCIDFVDKLLIDLHLFNDNLFNNLKDLFDRHNKKIVNRIGDTIFVK